MQNLCLNFWSKVRCLNYKQGDDIREEAVTILLLYRSLSPPSFVSAMTGYHYLDFHPQASIVQISANKKCSSMWWQLWLLIFQWIKQGIVFDQTVMANYLLSTVNWVGEQKERVTNVTLPRMFFKRFDMFSILRELPWNEAIVYLKSLFYQLKCFREYYLMTLKPCLPQIWHYFSAFNWLKHPRLVFHVRTTFPVSVVFGHLQVKRHVSKVVLGVTCHLFSYQLLTVQLKLSSSFFHALSFALLY